MSNHGKGGKVNQYDERKVLIWDSRSRGTSSRLTAAEIICQETEACQRAETSFPGGGGRRHIGVARGQHWSLKNGHDL